MANENVKMHISVAVYWWAFGKMEPGARHQEVGDVFMCLVCHKETVLQLQQNFFLAYKMLLGAHINTNHTYMFA